MSTTDHQLLPAGSQQHQDSADLDDDHVMGAMVLLSSTHGYILGERLGRGVSGVVFAALTLTADDGRYGNAIKYIAKQGCPRNIAFEYELWVSRVMSDCGVGVQVLGSVPWTRVHHQLSLGGIVFKRMPLTVRSALGLATKRGAADEAADKAADEAADAIVRNIDVDCMCSGLVSLVDICHAMGFVHRDLKPENIMVSDSSTLFLGDWGVACKQDDMCERCHVTTRWYRAPEAHVDPRASIAPAADWWSVGCVIVEMVTGRPMFPSPSEEDHGPLMDAYCDVHAAANPWERDLRLRGASVVDSLSNRVVLDVRLDRVRATSYVLDVIIRVRRLGSPVVLRMIQTLLHPCPDHRMHIRAWVGLCSVPRTTAFATV
jgi:hypothetical protein